MRKFLAIIITCGVLGSIATANAHSGGTNQYGCHNNHKTGGYHCH